MVKDQTKGKQQAKNNINIMVHGYSRLFQSSAHLSQSSFRFFFFCSVSTVHCVFNKTWSKRDNKEGNNLQMLQFRESFPLKASATIKKIIPLFIVSFGAGFRTTDKKGCIIYGKLEGHSESTKADNLLFYHMQIYVWIYFQCPMSKHGCANSNLIISAVHLFYTSNF